MRGIIQRLFSRPQAGDGVVRPSNRDLQVAVCAMFIEAGRIDETFTPEEIDRVVAILREKYGLSREDADDLMAEAEKDLEESVDLWQFARRINENYSNDEKMEIVEMLWRIVYVDGKMDAHEHYLMNKVKNLFRLEHRQLIEAKQKVLQ